MKTSSDRQLVGGKRYEKDDSSDLRNRRDHNWSYNYSIFNYGQRNLKTTMVCFLDSLLCKCHNKFRTYESEKIVSSNTSA